MSYITGLIVRAAVLALCLLGSLAIYRRFRDAPWLAASTVASCLFFLSSAVIASTLVPGSLYLIALWLCILLLCILHLYSAHRQTYTGHPREYGQHLISPELGSGSPERQDEGPFYI